LGVDDYFNRDGICIIEWADRGVALLPANRIEIYMKSLFTIGQENARQIELEKASFIARLSHFPVMKGWTGENSGA
jgi:tRNA A37 threonylcarbamoyladenosine biosynthesis protein TsaE